jgi:nucleoside-diphosphate-sugar epimerase
MKIFLTGGTGMVGRNILENPSVHKHDFFVPTSQELNLLDRDAVRASLSREMPDLIIHSAGLVGGIQANINNPVDFLLKNTDMAFNVISSAASVGVKNLINLGSSCMYPREASNPLNVNLILQGELEPTNEGYALAKIVAARLCEYIVREDPTKNYKTLIPCNLYGRHDKYGKANSHLIPAVIRKIHEAKLAGNKTVTIWGDGSARREFMNAADLAEFIYFVMDRLERIPQNLNVGLGHDYSIAEYYRAVASVVGFEGSFEYDLNKPVGMRQKLVDVSQLESLGWRHKINLMDGINEAYNFYRENLNYGV